MDYKPRAGILRDCDLSMQKLSELTYFDLSAEDKHTVDLFCLELDEALLEKRLGPHGIGTQGMRELALALIVRLMEPGKIIEHALLNGVKRKCKECK